MAIPRIFISSTCYDLQEIRFQLRNFIRDFGYEAVLSEFDDIFYSYTTHVQDSCIEEIGKCQLFLLVVGNNYGSFYHQDLEVDKIPDSVTLKEFKRALDVKIYKHIFISKYVDYDYKNYKRALNKVILEHFKNNNVATNEVEAVKNGIKARFDLTYPFPYDSYQYVFYFLDIIYDLVTNNAVCSFETFVDIKENLKKQWAGFMYESIAKQTNPINSILQPIESKIEKIDRNIMKLIESRSSSDDNKLSFNLENLMRDVNLESLLATQKRIHELLKEICTYEIWSEDGYSEENSRVFFRKKFDSNKTLEWLTSLSDLIQSFKWSINVSVMEIFKNCDLAKYSKWHNEIPYATIFEFYGIFSALPEVDIDSFVTTVNQELNKHMSEPELSPPNVDDDLPF